MTPTILQEIAARKQEEIKVLYARFPLETLQARLHSGTHKFQKIIDKGEQFFITEFKRRSPSNPAIGLDKDPVEQAKIYIEKGTSAISVLTDEYYFGGSYDDMARVCELTKDSPVAVLNKDFILDQIQIYLARYFGADIILLITAILSDEQLVAFYDLAVSLGMGTIAEVHTQEERDRVVRMGLPVIGINNRDLHTFATCLNTTNYLAWDLPTDRTVIAESGMETPLDFAICGKYAQGFLVGTSLMQNKIESLKDLLKTRYFLKACGVRKVEDFELQEADLLGVNFSKKSKRKVEEDILSNINIPSRAVALFYRNTSEEKQEVINKYMFRYIQSYLPFVAGKYKRILALQEVDNDYPSYSKKHPADLYILDGKTPGSGKQAEYVIPADFPYPFLLAGGMNIDTIERVMQHKMCIGVDVASGIETNNQVDYTRVISLRKKLDAFIK